ncbi:MAG TPA: hypothetical protein VGY54_22040 [Polyangiaceae bacterium]|nr:hypothetical protein [Polyangiaceae bacterium]
MRWLSDSAKAYLPRRGRYRVLLVAFTDLHIPLRGRPQRWDVETAMEGPGLPATEVLAQRRMPTGYRVGVYVYEYVKYADGEGTFVPRDTSAPAEGLVDRFGAIGAPSSAGSKAPFQD